MNKVYRVGGMSCNHCKASIEKNIGKLEGVTIVKVDLDDGYLYVEGNLSEQTVKQTIEELGFEYKGILEK